VDKVDGVAMASPKGGMKEDQQEQEGTYVGAANNVAADSTAAVAIALEATHLEGAGEDGLSDPAAKRPRVGSSSDAAAVARAPNGDAEDDDMKSISSSKKSDDEWTRGGLGSDGGDDMMSVETFDFSSADSECGDGHEGTNTSNNGNLSRPFDAKLVVQGIERGEPVLDKVDGRDVVLVVGKTGTGKSTLIQAIAGRTLQETKHTCGIVRGNEITVDKIVYEAVDPLVGFEIGHGKTSKTASIGCYDAPPCVDKAEGAGLLYVDSPGFEDTNGQEADIATSVMLSEVAKRCRSLRFVIMISYVSLLEDRGGAMRSVLRLIRSFAKDFYEEKKSFMFLFTHSNEIAGVPDSIEGARSCVEKEVIRMLDGTKDEDTKAVLEVIRKCLRKAWPFADVFLPLRTDAKELASLIEKRLKPIEEPHLATTCGLTQSSRLTLSGEIQNQLQRLRRELSEGSPNADRVSEALKLFRYFCRYISMEDIRNANLEVDRLLKDYITQQIVSINDELIRGTYSEHDFGAANAAAVKVALFRLRSLQDEYPGEIDCDSLQRSIRNELDKFQEQLMLERGKSFSGIHRHLSKISAWSQEFPDVAPLYETVTQHLAGIIKDSIAVSVEIDAENLAALSFLQLEAYIKNLGVLQSIAEDAEYLSTHALDVNSARDVYEAAVVSMRAAIKLWAGTMSSKIRAAVPDEDKLRSVAKVAVCVEALNNLFELVPLCPDIKDDIETLRIQIAAGLVDCFNDSVSTLELESLERSPHHRTTLNQFRLASELFGSIGGEDWMRVRSDYNALIERIKASLRTRSGELDEMSFAAKQQGVRDGQREALMLDRFRSIHWLDGFLPQEDSFLQNSSIKFARVYKDRIAIVRGKVFEALQNIADESVDSGPAVQDLRILLQEMEQIALLAPAIPEEGLCSIVTDVRTKLQDHLEKLAEDVRPDVIEWEDIAHNIDSNVQSVELATERLEYVLREIEFLRGIDSNCDTILDSVCSGIYRVCEDFSRMVTALMETRGKYEEKERRLKVAVTIGKYSHVAELLPEISELTDMARSAIAADAKEIEDLVSETSEWDDIDSLLMRFQGATILDSYTSNEASSRMRPLLQLREKKQEQVDNLIEQLIRAQDFSGIREFLVPYVESRDQFKKQKFSKWLGAISSSLSDTVGTITRDLEGDMTQETCERVAQQLQRLQRAQTELKEHLRNLPGGLRLKSEIANAKGKINSKCKALFDKFDNELRQSNYEGIGASYHFIGILFSNLEVYISPKNKNRIRAAKGEYDAAIKDVSRLMIQFVDSGFAEEAKFPRILSSLKSASDCICPHLDDLADLYDETRKSLTVRLNKAFDIISVGVSKSRCYDDALGVMNDLNRHLCRGLKDHVVLSDLSFDSETQLEEWREEKQKIDREMEFDGNNADDKLGKWKILLDGLDPDSTNVLTRKYRQWSSGTTYQLKVQEVRRILDERFKQGNKALKEGNFSLLDESIRVLDLISHHLCRHIDNAEDLGKTLKDMTSKAFLRSCEKAQKVLQSDQIRQFEAMFMDYRGFVLQVPFVMASDESKKAFTLTNHLLHDAFVSEVNIVSTMLQSFDYETLKSKVQHARKFGGFLADKCTLFHEELKSCEHIDGEDRWLEEIFKLCLEHFSRGRSFGSIGHFAVLGLPPSASETDIKKMYKKLAKKFHPDKTGTGDSAEFRRATEAKDALLEVVSSRDDNATERPFGILIKGIGTSLRKEVKCSLEEQRYERVEKLLFKLSELKALESLVTPKLNHREISKDINDLVRAHVEQVRVNVDSNWSSKKYRALNDTIADLKLMEDRFKSYPNIFPTSWDDGIVKKVEQEIESLGCRARGYISSNRSAKQNLDDFRRCFLNMGHVLVELPQFKDITKAVMCSVLEACLGSDWGYSFLFEFGLGLQRGDENSSDEDNHVAQVLVAEFSHFKEVMTMVWNEETTQKPAEDTVHGIKGYRRSGGHKSDFLLSQERLLESFNVFDSQYKICLGEYIAPDADLAVLVKKTTAMASKLHPIDCNSGWDEKVKSQMPHILAGVFTCFTVLKSGSSYNRLGSNENGGDMSQKLLMKPHNIQVLTLLSLFGCGSSSKRALDSQLMQIRTGEGKSMILGTAAVVLSLLGFRARCVCYSEYLSRRDFNLFQDVFDLFGVTEHIIYSKITTLSEDTTAAKGDVRNLTEAMLRGRLEEVLMPTTSQGASLIIHNSTTRSIVNSDPEASATNCDVARQGSASSSGRKTRGSRKKRKGKKKDNSGTHETSVTVTCQGRASLAPESAARKEILLVDEVDVFFGADFYGQTYNQVTQMREPEVVDILNHIWIANKRGGRRQRLAEIQALPAYSKLLAKMPNFKFLLDGEISLMIDQVRKVDEEPYFLDHETDRIGYKVMDSISYEATYGYRTVFAYLQEAEKGNLKHKDSTLAHALAMQVSCGQFSYANISPERILGVSGTLSALGDYECDVLSKYGVETFMYVPSVYGESNFSFDQAGEGVLIETSQSDYFHSITNQIQLATKQKRAVIVFFKDNLRLKEFTSSPFYRKLSRSKKLLTEDLSAGDKEFVISKAATAGQITISTAVFGRGTDFFCKDETVQRKGGVHVIQGFLSEERSEEIQIQGRTARQGKKGSYQMILLDSDLEDKFGLSRGTKEKVPKKSWYQTLCSVRDEARKKRCRAIQENLADATEKDVATHKYFDALLAKDTRRASKKFKEIYSSFKKGSMPSSIELDLAFLVDVTGSMAPYARAAATTANSLLVGTGSITEKLKSKFPDIEFQLRVGVLGYRDIEDSSQFTDSAWQGNGHFTNNVDDATRFIQTITGSPSGGGDVAEDHLGAIDRCINWNSADDWTSQIKFMLLLTDAPAHGMVPAGSAGVTNVDSYAIRHPTGLTAETTIDSLVKKDVDLFICSFNPAATATTEKELSRLYGCHPENTEQRQILCLPLVPVNQSPRVDVMGGDRKHIVFVLDMSGSMRRSWSGVVAAYNQYLARRRQSQSECDLISVVQFDDRAQVTVSMTPIGQAPDSLVYRGGGTQFHPAAQSACQLASGTPSYHAPVVVFMSDGCANDAAAAAGTFSQLSHNVHQSLGSDLELHVIAFGGGASTSQLQQIAGSSRNGKLHTSADTAELSSIFVEIAGGGGVVDTLETEIGKRISEAVSDRLDLEYIG